MISESIRERIKDVLVRSSIAIITCLLAIAMLGLVACSSDDGSSSDASSQSSSSQSSIPEPDAVRSIPDPEAPKIGITVVVDPTAANESGASVDGFAEPLTFPSLVLTEGDCALDSLFDTGVVVTTQGSYVTDINGLAAGAAGSESGWVYEVNSEMPFISAIDYRLADGDVVTWRYVTTFEG